MNFLTKRVALMPQAWAVAFNGLLIGLLVGFPAVLSAASGVEQRPNVLFVLLDDLGYSQIEAFARGLSPADCDPALLQHVREKGDYTPEDAFAMMQKASPTISRLADEGISFTNALACSNLCAPARIGIATGILQNRWGIYRNIDTEAHGLKPNSHLAEKLQAGGYATAHIGKWHIGSRDQDMVQRALEANGIKTKKAYTFWTVGKDYPEIKEKLRVGGFAGSVVEKDHPLKNGFDYYFGYNQWECPFYNATNVWENFEAVGVIREYNTDVFTEKALGFMQKSLSESKPFYVQLHYHAVHHPLTPKAPAEYYERFDSSSHTLNNFYAHVYGVDKNLERILAFLKANGQADNTMIIFASDNGGAVGNNSCLPGNAPFAGHKGMLLQGGFRVPLFVHWPAGIQAPAKKDQLVVTLDILPTVLDAAGIALPAGLDGKSLLPLITGESAAPVRSHFVHGGIHARVWAFHGSESFYQHNESRELAPSGFIVADERYVLRYVSKIIPSLYRDAVNGLPAEFALFDYLNDPLERENLIEQNPGKARQLMDIWAQESTAFPEPVEWDKSKWESMISTWKFDAADLPARLD